MLSSIRDFENIFIKCKSRFTVKCLNETSLFGVSNPQFLTRICTKMVLYKNNYVYSFFPICRTAANKIT